jgi:hypothetical protein
MIIIMNDPFLKIKHIVRCLESAKIFHRIDNYREDAISIRAVVPGQRWEIDVLEDGSVVFEVFKSDGTLYDELVLEDMIKDFSD